MEEPVEFLLLCSCGSTVVKPKERSYLLICLTLFKELVIL